MVGSKTKNPYYVRTNPRKSDMINGKSVRHVNTESDFWAKVQKTEGCWLWTGAAPKYGTFMLRGKNWSTHRLSFTLAKGEIPKGKLVCHTCDNRFCVNPDHLFLGSHKDNYQDSVVKGRNSRGEFHGNSKISDEIVRKIRAEYQPYKVTLKTLANKYQISACTAHKIIAGEAWRHVDG